MLCVPKVSFGVLSAPGGKHFRKIRPDILSMTWNSGRKQRTKNTAVPRNSVQKPPSQKVEISAKTYEVKKGDSLYGISRKFYGDSSHMDKIFQANRGSLKSKNSLKPGQKLIIPAISQP